MKGLCLVSVVNRQYERFIPLFALSVFRAYPSYAVRIYLQGKLTRSTRQAIAIVSGEGDLRVIEDCFAGYPKRGQLFKSLRWILSDDTLHAFKYVYLGDVDMFICREKNDIVQFHALRCRQMGLPYSNAIRPGSERLSGLHFVITTEYFAAAAKVIAEYDGAIREGNLRLPRAGGNENLLYRMMSRSIGLPSRMENQEDFARARPHHGIHLGLWRRGNIWNFSKRRNAPATGSNTSQHRSFWEQFLEVERSAPGSRILTMCRIPEVQRMKRAYAEYVDSL